MIRLISMNLLLIAATIGTAQELTLVKAGASEYRIVLDRAAIPAEKTAAKELQVFLRLISGCRIPIVTADEAPPGKKKILVGQSAEAATILPEVSFDTLKPDETIRKTSGETLLLCGGRPRGSLYAVYTFLEEQLGVHWWTATEAEIPKKKNITIPALNLRYAPKLEMRDVSYLTSWRNQDPAFIARMKLNGWNSDLKEEYGCHIPLLGACHSFYRHIPPSKYRKAHPEWFSGHQLCLSNGEMRKELVKNVISMLDKEKAEGKAISLASVCQEDARFWCECAECKKIIRETGGLSGYLIRFINQVADEVAAVHPETKIVTFAYDLTISPDFKGKVNDNVVIHFAALGANFGKPLDSEQNAETRRNIEGWRKKAKNIIIWNYIANFTNYLVPHTNSGLLGKDIRFFIRNNGKGIFQQASGDSSLDDMCRFKNWYTAQLLWNPDQDEKKLRKTFLDGYYGAGGKYIGEYLDYTDALTAGMKSSMSCYHFREPAYFTDEVTLKCLGLFQKALDSVKDSRVFTERIQRDSLPLALIVVNRWIIDKVPAKALEKKGFENPEVLFQKLKTAAKKYRLVYAAEGKRFSSLMAYYEAEKHRLPEAPIPEKFAGKTVIDIQMSPSYGEGVTEIVDKKASDHIAFRIDGKKGGWDIMFSHETMRKHGSAVWDIYLSARAEGKTDTGKALNFGVYSYSSNRNLMTGGSGSISMQTLKSADYRLIHAGSFRYEPKTVLWCGGPARQGEVDAVYVDRILLVKR